MRSSLAGAGLALSIALLAGCSTSSPGASALPGSVSQSSYPVGMPDGWHGKPQFPNHFLNQKEMLKWWLEGQMPGPAPKATLKLWIKQLENRQAFHPQVRPNAGKPGLWVGLPAYGYLLGQTKNGKKTVVAVNVSANSCSMASGLKVDHSRNVVVPCAYTATGNAGGAQIYDKSGNLTSSYNAACPTNVPASQCQGIFGFGYDAAESGSSLIVSNEYFETYYCNPSCLYNYMTGFEVFTSPSSPPYFANVYYNGAGGLDIYDVGYMDVDPSGNVYAYYYGLDNNNGLTGTGVAEFSNLTAPTGVTVTDIVPAGTLPGTLYGYWSGVAVNGAGGQLTVIQNYNQSAYVYPLPFANTPTTLGPTLKNIAGCGQPIAGGWSKGDSKLAIGDACGWVDALTSSNSVKAIANINFAGASSAAYSPSDK